MPGSETSSTLLVIGMWNSTTSPYITSWLPIADSHVNGPQPRSTTGTSSRRPTGCPRPSDARRTTPTSPTVRSRSRTATAKPNTSGPSSATNAPNVLPTSSEPTSTPSAPIAAASGSCGCASRSSNTGWIGAQHAAVEVPSAAVRRVGVPAGRRCGRRGKDAHASRDRRYPEQICGRPPPPTLRAMSPVAGSTSKNGRSVWADTFPEHERTTFPIPRARPRRRRCDRRRRAHRAVDSVASAAARPGACGWPWSSASTVGFGASGRNGGWCSALLPMSLASIEAEHGAAAATRMQQAMLDNVARGGRVRRRPRHRRRLPSRRHDLAGAHATADRTPQGAGRRAGALRLRR